MWLHTSCMLSPKWRAGWVNSHLLNLNLQYNVFEIPGAHWILSNASWFPGSKPSFAFETSPLLSLPLMNWQCHFLPLHVLPLFPQKSKTHRFVLSLTPPALSHDFQHGGAKVTPSYFAHGYFWSLAEHFGHKGWEIHYLLI